MELDEEIVQEFLVESHENLDQLDRDLVAPGRNPNSHELLASIFRTIHGHEVSQAENGQAALGAVRGGLSSDLILSDWDMPEMNGIDFLRALRADGRGVPFGFVTSEGTPSMREQAAEAGASFLIAKPFTVEAFQHELAKVL